MEKGQKEEIRTTKTAWKEEERSFGHTAAAACLLSEQIDSGARLRLETNIPDRHHAGDTGKKKERRVSRQLLGKGKIRKQEPTALYFENGGEEWEISPEERIGEKPGKERNPRWNCGKNPLLKRGRKKRDSPAPSRLRRWKKA